jgi:hypothetical protein
MRGDLLEARKYLENAVELYRAHDGARLVFPSPQDPLVGSLCALMVALDALGDDAGADRVEGELEAHVERLGRAYDRAYSLCFRAMLASLRRNYPILRARADEALTVCNEQSYPIYSAIASFYKGVAVGHLENVDAGLHMAMTAFDALDRIGCKHARSLRQDDIARLRMAMGDIGDALSLVDIAIAESIASGETFPLPILGVTRSEILARSRPTGAETAKVAAVEHDRSLGAADISSPRSGVG